MKKRRLPRSNKMTWSRHRECKIEFPIMREIMRGGAGGGGGIDGHGASRPQDRRAKTKIAINKSSRTSNNVHMAARGSDFSVKIQSCRFQKVRWIFYGRPVHPPFKKNLIITRTQAPLSLVLRPPPPVRLLRGQVLLIGDYP
ncbi:hypothetical protein GWI33_016837 [Rhynchophorus ferrugineus]|uniref:Uncharacterized protein n=1 Tax=Rhynchophorus ferrugineus TaxID=354439 RepID=A0A834I2W4_RHYFE|nr:hypothetical protein GWI33_016837 [Rhynchophorus ferrugineus]